MATLVIYRGEVEEQRLELGAKDVRIGRAVGNDLLLDTEGKSVSRFHAELRHETGAYVVVDLNSQNGVWMDGERVRRKTVKDGAAFVIGPYRLVLHAQVAPVVDGLEETVMNPRATLPADAETIAPPPPVPVAAARAKPAFPVAVEALARQLALQAAAVAARVRALPRAAQLGGSAAVILIVIAIVIGTALPRRTTSTPPLGTVAASASPTVPVVPVAPPPVAPPATPAVDSPDTAAASAPPPAAPVEAPQPTAVPPSGDTGPTGKPAAAGPLPPSEKAAKPLVPRARGESLSAYRARTAALATRYAAATAALERGDYGEAQRLLGDIVRDEPLFTDAVPALEKARAGVREEKRRADAEAARQAVAEGKRLEAAGSARLAMDQYLRAQGLDGEIEGLAATIAQLKEKMRVGGEDAFKRAAVLDAYPGKAREALVLYESAAQLLPPEHPNRAAAQARIAALKASIR